MNSPDNRVDAILAEVKRIQTNRLYRDRNRLFYTEGVRGFVQAVDQGFPIRQILFSEKLLINPVARKLVRQRRRAGLSAVALSSEAFRSISVHKRASRIAAVVKQRWQDLGEIHMDQGLCWTLLETVQSPGNLGTLIRSSAASGGAGFIFAGNDLDPHAPAALRSAMGTSFRQVFVRTDWQRLRKWIASHDLPVIGASPDATNQLHDLRPVPGTPLLVLGEEKRSLTRKQSDLCNAHIRIPMEPGTDSLNFGVAGSLLMYEVRRQRMGP